MIRLHMAITNVVEYLLKMGLALYLQPELLLPIYAPSLLVIRKLGFAASQNGQRMCGSEFAALTLKR